MDWCLFETPDGELRDVDVDVDVDFDHPLCPSLPPLFPSSPVCSSVKTPATTSVTAMTAAGVSPSSSPRLPSPPPFTEVQIGPKSPTVGESLGSAGEQLLAPLAETDDGSKRRIRPGTKAADMASGPPLVPLSQLDSPFQLQEHLKALYHHYTKPDGSRTVVPINREVALSLAEPPEGVERTLWLYELCRFLTMKVNNLIIAFFAEDPPCSAQTCPEMRASEWQYLCAVHDPPKSCCAIDYCCHTLDWATSILTSPKYFPSRLTLGSDAAGGPQASMRHLTNIFRRLYRIFAHAWFQHRGVFWQVEGHDGLYVFFKTVCDAYNLIPEDNYTVPREAEGAAAYENNNKATTPAESPFSEEGRRFSILRRDSNGVSRPQDEETEPPSVSTGATTRRHKHSPSTGSSVTTIAEGVEEIEQGEKLPEVYERTERDAEQTSQTAAEETSPAENETSETKLEAGAENEQASTEDTTEDATENTTTDAETDTETITPVDTEDSTSNGASKSEEGQAEPQSNDDKTVTSGTPSTVREEAKSPTEAKSAQPESAEES